MVGPELVSSRTPNQEVQLPAVKELNPLVQAAMPKFNVLDLQKGIAALTNQDPTIAANNSVSPTLGGAGIADTLRLISGNNSQPSPTSGSGAKILTAGNLLNMASQEQTPNPTAQRNNNPLLNAVNAGDKLAEELRRASIRGAIENAESKVARLTTERNKRDQQLADQAGTIVIEGKIATGNSDIAQLKAQLT